MANECRFYDKPPIPKAPSPDWDTKYPGPTPWDFWGVYNALKRQVAASPETATPEAQSIIQKYEQIIKEHSK